MNLVALTAVFLPQVAAQGLGLDDTCKEKHEPVDAIQNCMGSLKCLDAVLLQKPCEFNRARCSCQAAVSCNSDLWGPCANCPLLEFHRLCVLNDGRFGYCFYDNCFECTSSRHCKDKSKSKCYSDGNCAAKDATISSIVTPTTTVNTATTTTTTTTKALLSTTTTNTTTVSTTNTVTLTTSSAITTTGTTTTITMSTPNITTTSPTIATSTTKTTTTATTISALSTTATTTINTTIATSTTITTTTTTTATTNTGTTTTNGTTSTITLSTPTITTSPTMASSTTNTTTTATTIAAISSTATTTIKYTIATYTTTTITTTATTTTGTTTIHGTTITTTITMSIPTITIAIPPTITIAIPPTIATSITKTTNAATTTTTTTAEGAGCSSHHLCNHECTSSGAVCDVFITSTTATHATASLPETPVIDRLLPYLLLIGVVAGCSLLLCGIYKYICRRYLVYSRDPLPAAISFLEINRKKDETSETFSAEKPRIRPMASQDNYDITEQQTASPIVPPFSSIRVTSAIDISSRHLNHSCPDWDLVLPIISSADIPIANQSLDRGRSQGESTAIWRPIRTITTYG